MPCLRQSQVVLLEAASDLGGQVLIGGGTSSWRKDLIGLIDWRIDELAHLGVSVQTNVYAEVNEVMGENPDVVIIATGGTPDVDWIDGVEHCTTSWDYLTGSVAVKDEVLVYDGTSRNPAMACAERAAVAGKNVELVALDGSIGPKMTYSERNSWKQIQYELNIPVSFDLQLKSVTKTDGKLVATFVNEVTGKAETKVADQVVVERGTLPVDDLYHDLRGNSTNDGVTDIDRLLLGHLPT